MLEFSFNVSCRALVSLLVGVPLTGLLATSAVAQEGASGGAIEEILVTARKRQESVLEIPETVVAISGDDIARQDIVRLSDIGQRIPNLNLSMRTDGFPNATIRGVGSFGNTQGVGFYLDDAQIFSDASSRFGDLERIEVLKGPQGTLYGGSNIGGAIKYVSRRPDPSEVSGNIKLRVGEQNTRDIEGSINVPLGDNGWAARVFGFWAEDDGYLRNPNYERENGFRGNEDSDIGEVKEYGGRASIAGPIGERFSVFAAVRYNDLDGPANTWVREVSDNLKYPDVVPNNPNGSHDRDTFAATLELTWELDSFDIVSLTSYTDTDSTRFTDVDIREEFIISAYRPEDMTVTTQELRFTSTHEGPFQWIAGGFYSLYEEKMRSTQNWYDARVDDDGNISGPLGCAAGMPTCSGVWVGEIVTPQMEQDILPLPFEIRDRDKENIAGFASGTYTWENWEFTAGLRVDRWENKTDNKDTGISGKENDTEVLPRVSITRWFDENNMMYFTFAQGYEPGGFNLSNFEGESTLFGFDEENATSYELGWKGQLADGRLYASIAAFYIDYEDRQIEFQAEGENGVVIEGIVNLGDSEQYGFEAEALWQATDTLSLTGSFGWIDAEWDNGTIVDLGDQVVDVGGDTPPNINDWGGHLSADWRQPFGDRGLTFLFGAQLNYSGEFDGLQVWNPITNPDYTVVNTQVGVAAERWEFTVNVKNLFDEDYYTDLQRFPNLHVIDGAPDEILIGTRAQPRLVTGNFTYRF